VKDKRQRTIYLEGEWSLQVEVECSAKDDELVEELIDEVSILNQMRTWSNNSHFTFIVKEAHVDWEWEREVAEFALAHYLGCNLPQLHAMLKVTKRDLNEVVEDMFADNVRDWPRSWDYGRAMVRVN